MEFDETFNRFLHFVDMFLGLLHLGRIILIEIFADFDDKPFKKISDSHALVFVNLRKSEIINLTVFLIVRGPIIEFNCLTNSTLENYEGHFLKTVDGILQLLVSLALPVIKYILSFHLSISDLIFNLQYLYSSNTIKYFE